MGAPGLLRVPVPITLMLNPPRNRTETHSPDFSGPQVCPSSGFMGLRLGSREMRGTLGSERNQRALRPPWVPKAHDLTRPRPPTCSP